jgi:hypothetical protein
MSTIKVNTIDSKSGSDISVLQALDMADKAIKQAEFTDFSTTLNTVAASGATETLNCETANAHDVTLTAACTLTFSNPPASGKFGAFSLLLRQNGTGTYATTWPASVDWDTGTAPTLVTDANSVSNFVFWTVDGGTIWHGALVSSDSK